MSPNPRIALIHALEESVIPARQAFAEEWPEARIFDLMDTSLAVDHAERGKLDDVMVDRFLTLGRYASGTRGSGATAEGILFTCSAFGAAIDAVKRDRTIPVFRPNEAAFAEAVQAGGTIAVVVSFRPSLATLMDKLRTAAREAGASIEPTGVVVEAALPALKAGRGEEHDRLIAEAAAKCKGIDTFVLGQFSLARAKPAVAQATGARVITTPHSAVRALKRTISG